MTPRKQMVLKARTTCPICESAKLDAVSKTQDGTTKVRCRSCGHVFEVPTEAN